MTKKMTYLQDKDLFIYSTDDYLSYDEVITIKAGYERQLCTPVAVISMCSSFQVVTSENTSGETKDDHLSPASTELLLSIMQADKEVKSGAKTDKAIPIQSYSQEDIDSALKVYHKIMGTRYCAIILACGEQYLIVSERHNGGN